VSSNEAVCLLSSLVLLLLPITNAHPEGRNGVEHSEALRRVVRAGSRGIIGPQRGKLNQMCLLFLEEDATTQERMRQITEEDATEVGGGP
jgi:hypothetical protein